MSDSAVILLVEDEPSLAAGIRENLIAEGHEIDVAVDGTSALARIRSRAYDLLILDVMIPEMDGVTVCETARREGCDSAVLFLTARGGTMDRIRGLEAGGDDYLTKPFHLRELLLRVAAILRRRKRTGPRGASAPRLMFGGNVFDFDTFQGVSWDGHVQALTHKEALILRELSQRDGQVVWREDLLERVWGDDVLPSSRTIDNFIVRLRRRFEPDPEHPVHFHTVRGVGYRFTARSSSET